MNAAAAIQWWSDVMGWDGTVSLFILCTALLSACYIMWRLGYSEGRQAERNDTSRHLREVRAMSLFKDLH